MPPGPAPPLPAGPPPPQPPYQQDAQAAAHAAAWAAYYQSQGQPTGSTYTPPAAGAAAGQSNVPGASNPYANYGYSAAASAQHSAFIQGQSQPSHAGPSYRPPAPQQPQYPAPNAGQPYTASSGYGYQAPQQYPQQYPQQPQPAQGQGSYNWNAQPQAAPQQPYRPPPPPPAQPYNPPAQPSQPYYPQHQPYSPARPSPSPTPGPNRPYQPSPRVPSGPARPPMGGPGTPPHFPPAKRPRFDGPGNPPSGPSGPMNGNMQPNRPPTHAPIRPVGTNMGQPGFNARPLPASLPSAPRAPPASVPSGPSNSGTGYGSGGPSAAPVVRPPIHLGLNGPPPPLPFGGSMRGGRPARGGLHGASGGGHVGAGGRSGPVNAPRGPAGMRRPDPVRQNRENDKKRKDKDRERAKEKEEKITMTDFRIVGIEVKALGWSWGLTGDAAAAIADDKSAVTGTGEEKKDADEEESPNEEDGEKPTAGAGVKTTDEQAADAAESHVDVPKSENEPSTEPGENGHHQGTEDTKEAKESPVASDLKHESAETSESVEEKRGEKRKAKTPEGDEEGSSPKKRPGEYILTHRKPNESSDASAAVSSVHESNQNRFRIYFESSPELDRVPKALRRNPNKRWRRASSSVAPSVHEGQAKDGSAAAAATLEEVGEEHAGDQKDAAGEAVKAEVFVKEGEEAVGGTDLAHTDSTTAADIAKPEAELLTTNPANDTPAPVDNAAAEGQASGEPVPAQELPTVTDVTSQGDQRPDTDQASAPEEAVDISMVTDAGTVAAAINELVDTADAADTDPSQEKPPAELEQPQPPTDAPKIKLQGIHSLPPKPQMSPVTATQPNTAKSAAPETKPTDAATTLAASADNTALAYRSRTRRRSSVSSQGSVDETVPGMDVPTPSTNRVSILYEGSQRRLCIDASVVESVKVHRAEGRIEMVLHSLDKGAEGRDLPKGILVETYDTVDQRFASAGTEKLEELWKESNAPSLPPLHLPAPAEPVVLTVYLNKKRPLSEPKWCRNDSADEWLIEQFGLQKASSASGWKGKLKIVDPDPAPTLQSILDGWASTAAAGQPADRRAFTRSLQDDPYDLLEILLRLTRGDRNPTASASNSGSLGPLATAIRADSPFASHQTHVSLAILAMYRLTTDYAAKAGEKSEVVNEKISDIIKSLPVGMIARSLDGLFKEWMAK